MQMLNLRGRLANSTLPMPLLNSTASISFSTGLHADSAPSQRAGGRECDRHVPDTAVRQLPPSFLPPPPPPLPPSFPPRQLPAPHRVSISS
jgi:hypothetical protein